MTSEGEERAINKAKVARKSGFDKQKGDHTSNPSVKMCPFQDFRICNGPCKYYICHGRPYIIKERISKGYANEYLESVLF